MQDDTQPEISQEAARRRRPCVVGARYWIKDIPTERLPREIQHTRDIWAIYRGRDCYYSWFAVTLGVYRAEQRRRAAIAAAEGRAS